MPDRLPDVIDPLSLAQKRRHLKGEIPLSQLDRVAEALLEAQGAAKVELRFSKSGRQAVVTGLVEADLILQCQCCLGAMSWPVRSEANLGIVTSVDEALQLPESMEPLLVEADSEILLADVVQDELLLSIPAVPRHPNCQLPDSFEAKSDKPHPFAGLAELKFKLSSQE
ncbi:MAG: hypothetical protein RL661_228 [Pseudomonadota bacterium]|jgi:uncharacterized protein